MVTRGSHPNGYEEDSPNSVLIAIPQGELFKERFCHASFWGPHLRQVGEKATQHFDGFDLLMPVVTLQEATG